MRRTFVPANLSEVSGVADLVCGFELGAHCLIVIIINGLFAKHQETRILLLG
jgi:hypothetical protein